MIKMEKGKYYVTSLKKVVLFVLENMNIGDVYTFATDWDEEEFIFEDNEDKVSNWFGMSKIANPFEECGCDILIIQHYGGGDTFAFELIGRELDEMIRNLRYYISTYTEGTTLDGYVCFDPENQKKEKEEE